jgi:hypothetical protein
MKISIISQFRDEAKYLKEWIEFHLLVGVDDFYLTNHLSVDNYLEVLQPYIDKGIVKITDLLIDTNTGENNFINEQLLVGHSIPIMNKHINESDSDWVIFLNVDEFLYPTTENNIKDVINKFSPNVGQIGVNWRFMGNSNYRLKDNELITEKLTKCKFKNHTYLSESFDYQRHTKSLIRKESFVSLPSVHYGLIKQNYLHVDALGDPNNIESDKYRTKVQIIDNLVINHYVFRDLDYAETKINMYKKWGRKYDDEEAYKNQYNDEDNFEIYRFLPKLKENMLRPLK